MGRFGYDVKGSYGYSLIRNMIFGSKFRCPEGGAADSITVYIFDEDRIGPKPVKCAIYDVDLNLVGVTEEKVIPKDFDGWETFNFPSPPSLSIGAEYWLVVWNPQANGFLGFTYYANPGETNQLLRKNITYNAFPDPLTDITEYYDYKMSIYCTYTAAFTVTINSTPISVPVTVDGAAVGSTPVPVAVVEGEHSVAVPSESEGV